MADSLVALRDRREQAITRLSEAYAQDLFDVDELERRLDLAHGTASVAELDALLADLGPAAATATSGTALVLAGPTAIDGRSESRGVGTPTALPVGRGSSPVGSIDDPDRLETKQLRVIMSSVERCGRWSVPRVLDLRVLWGNALLDFRDASLGPGVTTIHVRVFMGNFEVVLPPNLAIDVDVSSFAGSVTERHRVPPAADPERPLIRIVGTVRFGNLEITTRLPDETARDATQREKRERKQLRKATDKALPPGQTL